MVLYVRHFNAIYADVPGDNKLVQMKIRHAPLGKNRGDLKCVISRMYHGYHCIACSGGEFVERIGVAVAAQPR